MTQTEACTTADENEDGEIQYKDEPDDTDIDGDACFDVTEWKTKLY